MKNSGVNKSAKVVLAKHSIVMPRESGASSKRCSQLI